MSRTRITSIIFIFSIYLIISSSFAADSIDSSRISPVPNSSTIGGSKDSKQTPKVTKIDKKKKNNQDAGLTTTNNELKLDNKDKDQNASCEGITNSCRNRTLLACVQAFRNDSNDVSFLVQNVGEDILKVHINILPSVKHALPDLQLQKHESKMINVTLDAHKSSKVILNAGNGECVFHFGHPVSVKDFLQQLSIYSKQVTPLYGAYVFFLLALISVGTWACCRFRKGRVQESVQYQQLEMEFPNSASAVDIESAEGWDQDWDDDWDDDDTVKPSSHRGSISANGLASRATRTQGWENDWDD